MSTKTWRITGWIALVTCLLALFLWLGLPLIIRAQINRGMADMKDDYVGSVQDVSIAWLDGRMSAHGMRIDRPGREVGAPFMVVKEIQIEIMWREATSPRIGLRFIEPVLNFIDAPGHKNDQKGPGFTLEELREKLPLDLGAVSLQELSVHFRNFHARPPIDTYVHHVNASASPLDRCIQSPAVGCAAKAQLEGTLMGSGRLRAHAQFAYEDAFSLNARGNVRNFPLKDLSPLLLEYADVDVQAGKLDLDGRVRVDGANYRVVLDPSLEGAKVIGGERQRTKAGREFGLALAARVLERMGEAFSIVLKGGPGKDLDWDIIRRDVHTEAVPTSDGDSSTRAHASASEP